MKNIKVLLSSIFVLPLLLTGCNNDTGGGVEIEFDDIIPTAYVGEEYDFSEVLIVEKDVEYRLEVYYFDYYEKVEKTLEVVNQYCFTPKELFDVTVVVNAKKGSSTQVRSKAVPVAQKVDPIDELLSTDGLSGWGDSGINKEAVVDDQYFKNENSHSALSVHFQGSNPYTWGTTFLSLNNFRLLPYWSDQTWENAVVHFWVYNPMAYQLEFQMRVYDKLTDLVNVDWGQALNVPQFAAPNAWTEVNFSLKHLGVNHTLYQNEEGTRDDSIIVKVKYGNTPIDGMEVYSYQFFVDDIDVIPYSEERFPDLDTKCYATAEDISFGWENMKLDDGWSRANVLFDREFVNSSEEHTSLSSMYLTFNGVTFKDGDEANGYCVILAPEAEFGDDNLPSFRQGTLDFDIHFSSNITDKTIKILAVQHEWQIFARVITTPVESNNEWMHVTFDFGEHNEFYNITEGIRLGICFPGIDSSNKDSAKVYLDNIVFDQNSGAPAHENLSSGWENMMIDEGWSRANVLFDREFVNSSLEHTSISSMCLSFEDITLNDGDEANGYCVILDPESEFGDDNLPSFRHGTLDFDVHFSSDITDKSIQILAVQHEWQIFARVITTPVEGTDEWMHVTFDFGEHDEFYNITEGIRLGICFPGIDASNKDNAKVHIDNIFFEQNGGVPEHEILSLGWENMMLDVGWSRANVLFNREFVNSSEEHTSLSSMCLTFDGINVGDETNGYCVILDPESEFGDDNLPSFRHGTLDFDVHFSSDITDKSIQILAVQHGWQIITRAIINPVEGNNEWMHVTFDFGEHDEFFNITEGIRLGICFPGVDNSNNDTAKIHLDNIFFEQNGGVPEHEILSSGWENMMLDEGWSRANILFDQDFVNSSLEHNSLSSMCLSFEDITLNDGDEANGYCVILAPEAELSYDNLPSFRHGTLDFDVHFSSDITNTDIQLLAVQHDWQIFARVITTPVEGNNEWMHVTFDFGEHNEFYNITKGIRLGFCFPGVDNSNKATAKIHLDNIIFNQNGGIPEESIEVIRGFGFTPEYALGLPAVALTETIVIDFKFTSGENTQVTFILGDGWNNYYGYYTLHSNGELDAPYSGMSMETLEDGYYRLTIDLSQIDLNIGQNPGSVTKIDLFYMNGSYTTAQGYIDFINPVII